MRFRTLILAPVLALASGSAYSDSRATRSSDYTTTSEATTASAQHPNERSQVLSNKLAGYLEPRIRQLYRDLFDSLALDPETADRVVDLLTEEMVLNSSLSTEEVTRESGPDDAAKAKVLLAEVETTIGSDAYAAFTAYRETLIERNSVNGLAKRLNLAALPLSGQQKEQLVNTLADARAELQPPLMNQAGTLEVAEEKMTQLDNFDAYFLQSCRSVLSVKQLEVAKAYFADRAQGRHGALERYREQIAAGTTTLPFSYKPE